MLPIVMRSPCLQLAVVQETGTSSRASPSSDRLQRRAGPLRQLARSRHVVGVDVRFGDVRDAQAFGSAAIEMYCSMSRLASMTIASPAAWHPIR